MGNSCTFAGHRDAPDSIERELSKAIADLVENKKVTAFYVGNHGRFDSLCARVVRVAKQNNKDIRLILVIPKMSSTIENNKNYYLDMYDEILIPAESDSAHYKSMITERNKWMVDNSDYIITYIRKNRGGAFKTYMYAQKQNTKIINI